SRESPGPPSPRPPRPRASRSQGVLELEEEALHLRAATVVADLATRADHAVAWDDDRDRVQPQGAARGPVGARVPGALGGVAIGDHLAERHPRGLAEHPAVEARMDQLPIERHLEALPLAIEVLVELAAGVVEAGGVLEDSRREVLGELREHALEVGVREG